ncbi:MAG TPA: PAS domain S-box protein [Rhizobiales bacterium]|nr:PAS domain S-box protein [Hyphomicrobiales bacterium]
MAQRDYSFLDIAVLDEVRSRFAAADAMAILSTDLGEVIWANGPGAALFGHADIESIMGAETELPLAARRQIMATPGFPEIGKDRLLTIRLASGMSSRIVGFLGSRISLPGGEPAILLVVPFAQGASRTPTEVATRAIGGFGEAGHHVALVDGLGRIEAASQGFDDLDIAPKTLEALAVEASAADDRLVKRLITAGANEIAAGMARLRDDPLLCLFVAVGTGATEEPSSPVVAEVPNVAAAVVEQGAGRPAQPTVDGIPTAAFTSESPPEMEPTSAETAPMPNAAEEVPVVETPEEIPPAFDIALNAEQPGTERNSAVQRAPDEAARTRGEPAEDDRWYFGPGLGRAAEEVREPAPAKEGPGDRPTTEDVPPGRPTAGIPPAQPAPSEVTPSVEAAVLPRADRAAAPVRFVWRTDANGRFSAISHEFAAAVGAAAADVVGRSFAEVAAAFGLDPDGEIAGLLERRDTWSGRSVLWPIADTDLRVPVDLAALPVYGRNRNFDGFRGFGVARTADAVIDPDAIGLSLARSRFAETAESAPAGAAAEPTEPAGAGEPVPPIRKEPPRREDPFRGEVPVLTLVPKPERRFSDKIIRLAEHRQPANDKGLTPVERNAFREIGDRLKRDGSALSSESDERPVTGADQDEKAPDADSSAPVEAESTESATDAVSEQAGKRAGEDTAPVPLSPETVTPVTATAEAATTKAATTEAATSRFGTPVAAASADEALPSSSEIKTDADDFASAGIGEQVFQHGAPQPGPDRDDEIVSAEDGEPRAPGEAEAVPDTAPTGLAERAGDAKEPAATADGRPEVTVEGNSTELPTGAAHEFLPSAFASVGGAPRPAVDTSILDKLPVPVLIHSGDVLHYANREFLEFTAYDSVEQLAERGGLGVLFGDPYRDESENDRADRKLRLRRGDGLELPVEALLQSVPWNGGKALLLALRKVGRMPVQAPATTFAAEEKNELEARIAELRTIIDTATDGVVLIANDGTIRSISRPAEALFGVDTAEVAGKPFTSLFAIESQRAARDYLNGLSENGVASVLNDGREVIGREAQGRFIPLFMTIGKLPNLGGYCAVVRDITQWKRAEEELTQSRAQAERASSQKTDFLARVSHEIRTPLNAIIGFSELMMDEKFGPIGNDRYRDYLRDINRSGNHVLDLVNDLLDISKIEAGEQEMSYEAVSLNDTLAETVAMMQPQANRERVIIRSSFASRLPEVVADLRSVRQIALNLLSNAIRYTQAGGQVVVSTAYEPSGDVVMRVRDTGIGMTQAEIEQALKPFKQISALKRGRGDGTGLGLPLTKAMVEANRARFVITSAPGEGTLVEVTFPSTRVLAE